MITKEKALELVIQAYEYRQTEVSEQDFCRKYTWGYWVRGNSEYDLLQMLTTHNKPASDLEFKTFEAIAQDFVDDEDANDIIRLDRRMKMKVPLPEFVDRCPHNGR